MKILTLKMLATNLLIQVLFLLLSLLSSHEQFIIFLFLYQLILSLSIYTYYYAFIIVQSEVSTALQIHVVYRKETLQHCRCTGTTTHTSLHASAFPTNIS